MTGIIPKPIIKPPLWQKTLLYFSLVLLVGTIVSYSILTHFQKKIANEIQTIEQLLTKQKHGKEATLETELFDKQKRIDDFAFIAEQHRYPSHFFKFLETSVHPELRFINLNLNPQENRVIINGSAKNFQALGQQMFVFQGKKDVSQASLSDIAIGEKGNIRFSINLLLSPDLFK